MNEDFLRDFFHLPPRQPVTRPKWEYKSVLLTSELLLHGLFELGAHGWELVAVIPPGILGDPGSNYRTEGGMIFKRPAR